MDRGLRLTQTVIGVLCLALVASLFLFGMVGGGAPADPEPTAAPTTQGPHELEDGERVPGELARPLSDVDRFDPPGETNPDRQLDYEPSGDPLVEFRDGLGDLRAYAAQPVEWERCGESDLCASVLAPLDWEDPAAAAVELHLHKVPSADPVNGPLFVNPGGPGAGGAGFAAGFAPDHWPGFDIVGWDPRGTGSSTHVVCGTTDQTDAVVTLDGSPDDPGEDQALQDGYRALAQQCRDSSGDLLDHISSVEVARDMDLLRHLLGAEKFNFVGVSYGTYIGAMYAELFPDTSGRLVLDAAVEITDDDSIHQVEGFDRAFVAWAEWCAGQDACVLGGRASTEIQEEVTGWLASLDASPLPVGDRLLTQTLAASGVAVFLYADDTAYRALAMTLEAAMQGDGTALLSMADQMEGRQPGRYETLAHAFPAMACVDAPDLGVEESAETARESWERAPLLGRHMGMKYACELWTADSQPRYRLTAAGADPILVIGTTGDSATPYEQAVRMADQLEPAVLLTYESAGHGAVTSGNACVDDVVSRFLGQGEVPAADARCS